MPSTKRQIIDLYDLYDLYDLLQMPLFAAAFRNPMSAVSGGIEADVSAIAPHIYAAKAEREWGFRLRFTTP